MEERLPGERLASWSSWGPGGPAAAVDGLCAGRDWAGLVDLRQRLDEAVSGAAAVAGHHLRRVPAGPGRAGRRGGRRAPAGAARSRWGRSPRSRPPPTASPSWPRTWPCRRWPGGRPGAGVRGEDLREVPGPTPRCWSCRWCWPRGSRPMRWPPTGPTSARSPTRGRGGGHRQRPGRPAWSWSGPTSPRALTDLVEVWTSESGGEARALVVDGGPGEAVAALGHREQRLGRVAPASAMARMRLGGGQRRGPRRPPRRRPRALRRLVGPRPPWPVGLAARPPALGAAVERLTWWVWDDGMPATGSGPPPRHRRPRRRLDRRPRRHRQELATVQQGRGQGRHGHLARARSTGTRTAALPAGPSYGVLRPHRRTEHEREES